MTEATTLAERRRLVVLAAELQRASVLRRLDRLHSNPARRVFGLAAVAARRPALLSLGAAAARFAFRAWRKRARSRKPQH